MATTKTKKNKPVKSARTCGMWDVFIGEGAGQSIVIPVCVCVCKCRGAIRGVEMVVAGLETKETNKKDGKK